MEINKQSLLPYLLYNKSFEYDEHITLSPVTMNDIISFQIFSTSITVRKNSIFREKKMIKMPYLDFLLYCFGNEEIEVQYKIPGLSQYYLYAVQLMKLCCKDAEITIDEQTGRFLVNDEIVTPQIFDDLRRIIIIQNDIDFDIDEFINYDTEQRLLKAQKDSSRKNNKNTNIEDYIDSLVIAMNTNEQQIMNMTIRKFWRYIKRYQLYENYNILKTGECSGMVSFKEPIEYWMTGFDEDSDKYAPLKTDEHMIKKTIDDANN